MKQYSIILPVISGGASAVECLKAIAGATGSASLELILVISVEADEADGFSSLAENLFSSSCRIVQSREKNWLALCKLGIKYASAPYLAFLYEKAHVQKGWPDTLIQNLIENPEYVCAGPLLLNQKDSPLGLWIQEAGYAVLPENHLVNLFRGIPVGAPSAKKRRVFQVISPIGMVARKNQFHEKVSFYANEGFNEVGTLAGASGRAACVIEPSARISLPERPHSGWFEIIAGYPPLKTDWEKHLAADGLLPSISQWLIPRPAYDAELLLKFKSRVKRADYKTLAALAITYPFWESAWLNLFSLPPTDSKITDTGKAELMLQFLNLFPDPVFALFAFPVAVSTGNTLLQKKSQEIINTFFGPPEVLLDIAIKRKKIFEAAGNAALSKQYGNWIANYDNFRENIFLPFIRDYFSMSAKVGLRMDYRDMNVWALWQMAVPMPETVPDASIGFSILMPVYNPKPEHLRKALDSVLVQTWPDWELCIADDASTTPSTRKILQEYAEKDKRVKVFFRQENGHIAAATNSALEMAEKPWCAFMDQDDLLAPFALAAMAGQIQKNPQAMMLFSDEDHVTEEDRFFSPHFKNDEWDKELLAGENFVCHLAIYKTERLRKTGGLRSEYPGAQDYDLVLRYTMNLPPEKIVHVPEILYHWRSHPGSTAQTMDCKPYVVESAIRACQDWLENCGIEAMAENAGIGSWTRIRYPVPAVRPPAAIIKSMGEAESLENYIEIFSHINWPHEIIFIVNKDCVLPEVLPDNCRILKKEKTGITALNEAAAIAKGEILIFLAEDIEPCGENWVEELTLSLLRPQIGAVGGKVMLPDGNMLNGAFLADASGSIKELFPGQRGNYYCWNFLARTVDALDGNAFATRKKDFMAKNGLDAAMEGWAFQDYCLRLGNHCCVWHPFALFKTKEYVEKPRPSQFSRTWDGKLKAFNKNILILKSGFSLVSPA